MRRSADRRDTGIQTGSMRVSRTNLEGVCTELLGRSIVEGPRPASHRSVNSLKCNGSPGIRTNSFRGCILSDLSPRTLLRAWRRIAPSDDRVPLGRNKALYGDGFLDFELKAANSAAVLREDSTHSASIESKSECRGRTLISSMSTRRMALRETSPVGK